MLTFWRCCVKSPYQLVSVCETDSTPSRQRSLRYVKNPSLTSSLTRSRGWPAGAPSYWSLPYDLHFFPQSKGWRHRHIARNLTPLAILGDLRTFDWQFGVTLDQIDSFLRMDYYVIRRRVDQLVVVDVFAPNGGRDRKRLGNDGDSQFETAAAVSEQKWQCSNSSCIASQ